MGRAASIDEPALELWAGVEATVNRVGKNYSDQIERSGLAKRFPWIDDYTPINEPFTTARFSCLYGHWYPHTRDPLLFPAFSALSSERAALMPSLEQGLENYFQDTAQTCRPRKSVGFRTIKSLNKS